MPDDRPDYKVYRSRPRLFQGRGGTGGAADGLKELRSPGPRPREERAHDERQDRRDGAAPATTPRRRIRRPSIRRLRPGRIVKWLLIALVGWIGISAVLFMVSAQIQR